MYNYIMYLLIMDMFYYGLFPLCILSIMQCDYYELWILCIVTGSRKSRFLVKTVIYILFFYKVDYVNQ